MSICMHTYRLWISRVNPKKQPVLQAQRGAKRGGQATITHTPLPGWGCGSADVLLTSRAYLVTTTLVLVAPVSKA